MMIKQKVHILSIAMIGVLISGCNSISLNSLNPFAEKEKPQSRAVVNRENSTISRDKVVQNVQNTRSNKSIDDIIFQQKGINNTFETPSTLMSKESIIVEMREEDMELLPLELRKTKIENLDYTNKSLGNVVKLILSQTPNIGLIVEPNVDLNKKVVGIIKNKTVYDGLKDVINYAGYNMYYNEDKKSLIISAFIQKKYFVPAGIFVERNANIALGGSGQGAISPIFDMNNNNIYQSFMEGLNNIGTSDKLISVDKQAGVIYVKERALYMDEVDDYIYEFVNNRVEQYSIELIVLQIANSKLEEFQFDLVDILMGKNLSITSLTGANLSASMAAQTGNAIIKGNYGYNEDGSRTSNNNFALNSFLNMVDQKQYGNIITKPNTIVQNHSLGYISVGKEISYLAGVNKEPDQIIDGVRVLGATTPEVATYLDGIQFAVRVDKYPRKDFIQLSLAKFMSDATKSTYQFDNNTYTLLDKDIKEGFYSASVQDGDIIILGGFKQSKDNDKKNEPLNQLGGIGKMMSGIVKNENSEKESYETMFMIKVNKVNSASDSYNSGSSYRLKDLYRKNQ